MKRRIRTGIAASIGMLLMILDTKTAVSGAQEGLRLCITTVIPSLLPFFLLSILLTSSLTGVQSRLLRPLGRLLRIPAGSESLILIGALGGYPTGAQAVSGACSDGQLTKTDARRMLGFCSNAGPAFLFGIAAGNFTGSWIPWALWLIHLLSALAVGVILPGGSGAKAVLPRGKSVTLSQALERAIAVMARVCGWIVIFRIVLAFANRWFLWFLGAQQQIMINGLFELTIGCTSLSYIPNEGRRFLLCAAFLGFGGLCVTMQTMSVTAGLGMGMYLPGKLLQCIISTLLAALVQQLAFPEGQKMTMHPAFYLIMSVILAAAVLVLQKYEKRCSIPAAVGV